MANGEKLQLAGRLVTSGQHSDSLFPKVPQGVSKGFPRISQGFPKCFPRVPKCFPRVPQGFFKGFQGFPKCFPGFPKGFQGFSKCLHCMGLEALWAIVVHIATPV